MDGNALEGHDDTVAVYEPLFRSIFAPEDVLYTVSLKTLHTSTRHTKVLINVT